MTTKSITRASSGQKDQVAAIVGALVKSLVGEIGVDSEGAQKLIEDAGAFKITLREPLMAAIRAHGTMGQFVSEEVASTCVYGSGYSGPKPFAEQAMILRTDFPHLGSFDEALAAKPVSDLMEGNFAIPHWSLIAPTYGQAVEKVMAAIAKKRPLYNYREDQLGSQQLKETGRKADAFRKLREEQKGHDILVVAGQFGRRHAGKSVRRAREVFVSGEFGFGAYEVAIMLLTHSERLTAYEDLWIDCAGDDAAQKVGETFSDYPYWSFSIGRPKFGFNDVDSPNGGCGSASGCLPE